MSNAGAQAHAFYRDVARGRRIWTIQDAGGYPAPKNASGERAQPFWSSLSRVRKIIKTVPDYGGFEPIEITWEQFRDEWLPELEREGLLVGVNWIGPAARGFDVTPEWVRNLVEREMENQRTVESPGWLPSE